MPLPRASWLRRGGASFLGWLTVGVAALNLLLFGYTTLTIERARLIAEEQAAQWAQNLSLALERELVGIISTTDVALRSVIDELYQQQSASSEFDAAMFNAYIERVRQRMPLIDGVRVTDADGILVYGTDVVADRRIDLSDREHFKTLRGRDDGALVISKPQRSRANGNWVIVFARRYYGSDGRFGGMAFVPIPVGNLTRTFARISLPSSATITLRGSDLGVIARFPTPTGGESDGEYVGQREVGAAFGRLLADGATEGTVRGVVPFDGVRRVRSFRKVGEYPLYLVVGRAEEEYLGEWREGRNRAVVTGAAFLLLTVSLSLLLYGSWTRLASARDANERLAHLDFLTGLANRRAFIAAAEREIARARRQGSELSLLMIDIDHFKQINDTCGHEVGDAVLRGLVRCTLGTLREMDVMGRWGGEEFLVLMPDADAASAGGAAERLRATVEECELTEGPLPIMATVSVGHASLREGEDFASLVRRADEALYGAKILGRNRVCAAAPD